MREKFIFAGVISAIVCLGGCSASDNSNAYNSNSAVSSNVGTLSNTRNSNIANTNSSMSPSTTKLTPEDSTFVIKAAFGGETEVQLGQLAIKNAKNPDVKAFGQRMVDDHSKANVQLKSLAGSKNIQIPADVGAKNKATIDQLSKLTGDAFDKAYMADMVKDHEEDVAEFQRQTTAPGDKDIIAFAKNTLPTLQEHLQMAKATSAKLK